jgi:hypothetical protein
MIDREWRDRVACALRRFASGRLHRYEFDRVMWGAARSADSAVVAVDDEIEWAFLNYGPNRLVGRHALTAEQRRNVARWVLFLRSDEPYEWPVRGSELLAILRAIRTLGKSWRANEEAWERAGERALWPFVSAGQLANVASMHPFAPRRGSAT